MLGLREEQSMLNSGENGRLSLQLFIWRVTSVCFSCHRWRSPVSVLYRP